MRRIHLIVNPRSGYGGHGGMLADLKAAMRAAGMTVDEYHTRAPADATRHAAAVPEDVDAIVIVGGDGTVSEVANGLQGRPVPMIPYPAGTENLLAKDLRIPRHPGRFVDVLQRGHVVPADLGRINGRNFLLIIGVGFDGEVVRRVAGARTGHISHLSYFWPIWRTFWEHDFPRMRIVADGEEIFHDLGMAFIGNISRYAVGMRICRDARYDDGLLDLVVFACRDQPGLLLNAAWTLLRMHPLKGDVIYRQFRHVRIESDQPVPSEIDGDPGPNTPLDIEVLPAQLRLLVPPPAEHGHWPWKGFNP